MCVLIAISLDWNARLALQVVCLCLSFMQVCNAKRDLQEIRLSGEQFRLFWARFPSIVDNARKMQIVVQRIEESIQKE